jgi:hypothetical protein
MKHCDDAILKAYARYMGCKLPWHDLSTGDTDQNTTMTGSPGGFDGLSIGDFCKISDTDRTGSLKYDEAARKPKSSTQKNATSSGVAELAPDLPEVSFLYGLKIGDGLEVKGYRHDLFRLYLIAVIQLMMFGIPHWS